MIEILLAGAVVIAGAILYAAHAIRSEISKIGKQLHNVDQSLRIINRAIDHLDDVISGDKAMTGLAKAVLDRGGEVAGKSGRIV